MDNQDQNEFKFAMALSAEFSAFLVDQYGTPEGETLLRAMVDRFEADIRKAIEDRRHAA